MAGSANAIADFAARVLLKAGTLDEAMAEILRTIARSLDWPLAIYWLADDARKLRCRAIWAHDTLNQAEIVEASRAAVLGPGEESLAGPVGAAYTRREAIWNDRLAADDSPRGRLAVAAGLKTAFAFPLAEGDRVLAVIELYALDARASDDRLLELMVTLSDQIGEVRRRMEAHESALEALERSRDEVSAVLASDDFAAEVRWGERRSARATEVRCGSRSVRPCRRSRAEARRPPWAQ